MEKEFKSRVLTGEDWEDILHDNLTVDRENRCLKLKKGRETGTYISAFLDSGMEGCRWHRIRLEAHIPAGASLDVSFHTTDHPPDREPTALTWHGCLNFLTGDIGDALVEAPGGRYISVKIEFKYTPPETSQEQENKKETGPDSPLLHQVKLYYPRRSYLRYLPGIYQEDPGSKEFLQRFLSLFESVLFDTDQLISGLPAYVDPMSTPGEFVAWLAEWVSLDLYELLGEKNREFILNAAQLYKKKGTPQGIKDLVNTLTGKKCLVKEYMNNVFHACIPGYGKGTPGKSGKSYNQSCTVDTANLEVLRKIGDFDDNVHYAVETGPNRRYSGDVIGLFIFLSARDREFIIKEDELYRIIDTFLPVLVRVEINIVEETLETYEIDSVIYQYDDRCHLETAVTAAPVRGVYRDGIDLKWVYSYREGTVGKTNCLAYKTQNTMANVNRGRLLTCDGKCTARTNDRAFITLNAGDLITPFVFYIGKAGCKTNHKQFITPAPAAMTGKKQRRTLHSYKGKAPGSSNDKQYRVQDSIANVNRQRLYTYSRPRQANTNEPIYGTPDTTLGKEAPI